MIDASVTRGEENMPAAPTKSLADMGFFEKVRDAVNGDPSFGRATEWFDGSVLLKIGDFSVWMKWYRGRIIDMHEGPSPLGFTFSLVAPPDTWRQIFELPRRSYRPWAKLLHYGEIATEGNLVEASRVLEAQFILLSHIEATGLGEGL
jgi:hypothetical protein